VRTRSGAPHRAGALSQLMGRPVELFIFFRVFFFLSFFFSVFFLIELDGTPRVAAELMRYIC
jgi:hypothetical protein